MSRRDPKDLQAAISRTEARLAELDDERRHVWRHLSALKAELSSVQRAEDSRQPAQQTELPTRATPMTSAEKEKHPGLFPGMQQRMGSRSVR